MHVLTLIVGIGVVDWLPRLGLVVAWRLWVVDFEPMGNILRDTCEVWSGRLGHNAYLRRKTSGIRRASCGEVETFGVTMIRG